MQTSGCKEMKWLCFNVFLEKENLHRLTAHFASTFNFNPWLCFPQNGHVCFISTNSQNLFLCLEIDDKSVNSIILMKQGTIKTRWVKKISLSSSLYSPWWSAHLFIFVYKNVKHNSQSNVLIGRVLPYGFFKIAKIALR